MDTISANTTFVNHTVLDKTPINQRNELYTTISLVSLTSIICMGGFWGNFVVASIVLRRKKMQTPTNWFVFNLAISDLAITIITIPLWIVIIIVQVRWPFGSIGCKYLVMPIMEHFAGVCVLTHTAVGVARYIIVKNSKIGKSISKKQVKIAIILIWIIAFIFLSAPLMGFLGEFRLDKKKSVCRIHWLSPAKRYAYRICAFILTYVIPMVATGFSYMKIHKIVSDSLKHLNGHISAEMLSSRRRQNRQLNKILMTMYVLFAITTLPLHLYFFLLTFSLIPNGPATKLSMNLLFVLFYAQVVTNPLVLFYMGENYRNEIYNLPLCCCVKRPHLREISLMVKGSFKGVGKRYDQRKSVTSTYMDESYRKSSVRRYRRSASKRNTRDSTRMNKAINLVTIVGDNKVLPGNKSIQIHTEDKASWAENGDTEAKRLSNYDNFQNRNANHNVFEIVKRKASYQKGSLRGLFEKDLDECINEKGCLLIDGKNGNDIENDTNSNEPANICVNFWAPIPLVLGEIAGNLESILHSGHHVYTSVNDEAQIGTRETII